MEFTRKHVCNFENADPWDFPFFGGGGGGPSAPSFKVWDGSLAFDLTKAVSFRGILFARPESQVAKTQVIPHLSYFDLDAGNAFNFSCVGYSVSETVRSAVVTINGKKWDFNDAKFIEVKDDFQAHTLWKYSGGVDLILCNQVVDIKTADRWLELKNSVCISIDELLKKKFILSFETFFQSIINFAKGYEGSKPSWDFSDTQGLRLAGKSIKDSIVHLLPKPLRDNVSAAERFAVRDIGK